MAHYWPISTSDGKQERRVQMAEVMTRTVRDTATDETGQGEHAVKDAVCRIGECEVLGTSRAKVTDGAEHAHCRETR